MSGAPVDLPGLLAALDPRATRPERNAWLVRLMRWLVAGTDTESPAQRLNLLIDALDHSDASRRRVQLLLANFWRQTDLASRRHAGAAEHDAGAEPGSADRRRRDRRVRLARAAAASHHLAGLRRRGRAGDGVETGQPASAATPLRPPPLNPGRRDHGARRPCGH